MDYNGLPKKQGLYDPRFEHDNCGIGFIANIDGTVTHDLVTSAIEILKNLKHRGGSGSDPASGDGAGILLQIPHGFMKKVCQNDGIRLPEKGDYGVGMLFLSPDIETRTRSLATLKGIILEEGQKFLGVREVPCYCDCIGVTAKENMPNIVQVFIQRAPEIKSGIDFERKLFVILKRAEREIRYCRGGDNYFYFASLSSRTIVYKGMLTPEQVSRFYLDLMDLDMKSAIAMVHSRFSTNTFPSWERAHPNRFLMHNGEINTIRGNINWSKARETMYKSETFGSDLKKIFPAVNEDGSDSAMLDNYIQLLYLSGYSLPRAIMTVVPEPWENDGAMDKSKKDFYAYNSTMIEPWDGPAAIGFTDGTVVGATLDRNGLRPARYYVTDDGMVVLSSEVGVLNIPSKHIVKKERLRPGKMLLIDTVSKRIIDDAEIKQKVVTEKPYGDWLKENLVELDSLEASENTPVTINEFFDDLKAKFAEEHLGEVSLRALEEISRPFDIKRNIFDEKLPLLTRQKAFGYSWEDIDLTLKAMMDKGEDPITAMGFDAPLAVLSQKPQLLYNYFKQLFAQVTNPPIDAIREQVVTSSICYFGGEGNLLEPEAENCRRIKSNTPILTDEELGKLKALNTEDFKAVTIPMFYRTDSEKGLQTAMREIFAAADLAVKYGYNILVLSDRGVEENKAAIPALLATAGLHHHLIESGKRMQVSIVLETGEPREVHHFATLVGYGANGINPYLAYETLADMHKEGYIDKTPEESQKLYRHILTKSIVKIMSKMGISTIQSYQGAQIFEALGLSEELIDKYFTGTVSRIGGMRIGELQRETTIRHNQAFDPVTREDALKAGGEYKWKNRGEYHIFNPKAVYKLQMAVRTGDYKLYKEFAEMMNDYSEQLCTIRSMLKVRLIDKPINIDQVEPVESIVKRFKTGAMSYGSISQEAHECMAIAMNRLGGKSNSGEGGERPERYIKDPNGDSRSSAIKQVASGRFGVTINYLQNAIEIQIKMAQGAKPGEGGHLPGKKVYPWIAKARNSTPGVSLISPPPHHDIYSIEDLAQLIHDLKNANRDARISVKLVSEAGVGTIAVGVAKGLADVILISGYDGGTGAAPRTSVRHTGLPWELGVAETHQALLMNNLRNRVTIETDGKLLTGRDVLVAALLGAEEFGFATGPLISMGCVMMRVCNLDTCPVGVATQNPNLRAKFCGKPEYVENFMKFIAQDLREWMAKIGVKTVNDLIGHVEKLVPRRAEHWKAAGVDLTDLLYQPKICSNDNERYCTLKQDHKLENSIDINALIRLCEPAIKDGKKINSSLKITNINRVAGTILSGEITKVYGAKGLPDDTINLTFEGSAGQSFGAFQTYGVTMKLVGDSNDYIGKGLSGGKIIVVPPEDSPFDAAENVIIGNVAFYGAIHGEAYINGMAGERFCVRNSGITAVIEGVGQHGCEYMTGGKVAILGTTGRNFGAGMSGGVAYVYNMGGDFEKRCNKGLVLIEKMESEEDKQELKTMIENHLKYTGSKRAEYLLKNWKKEVKNFVKVIPETYKAVVEEIKKCKETGMTDEESNMKAFAEVTGTAYIQPERSVIHNG
ncbi:MAG: glutamate synthase large subunit [Clostridiales bacterium]|nr:glutamate synthase large subunit [Clostridiales bacterium]